MSKIDEVRADMVKAMKAKDKDTKETLSMLLAALKNKAIDKREDLTPEEDTQVILKEIKQTKETLIRRINSVRRIAHASLTGTISCPFNITTEGTIFPDRKRGGTR